MTQKLALITGASRGLGSALAELLAPSHHIIAVARTSGALEELDDRIQSAGGTATLAPLDITNDGAMQHLCRSIHERWGGLDLWVHTAIHAAPLSPAGHTDAKDFDKSVLGNVTATQRLITYVEPLLLARPGSKAVFFDDPRGGEKFFSSYGATKAAQITLARSWRAETEKTGPTVRILNPAAMPTGVRARFYPGEDRSALTHPADVAQQLLADIVAP